MQFVQQTVLSAREAVRVERMRRHQSDQVSDFKCPVIWLFTVGLLDYGKNQNHDYFGQY